jgi:hypothetical protein
MSHHRTSFREKMNKNFPRAENNFRKKKPEFQILEEDFPALSSDLSFVKKENMDYLAAVELENLSSRSESDKFPDGWVKLTFENNNSGSINYELIGDYQNLEESIETQTSRAINNLIQNWETYKVKYDNLHGEDAYNKIYGTYFDEYTNLEYISDSEDEY